MLSGWKTYSLSIVILIAGVYILVAGSEKKEELGWMLIALGLGQASIRDGLRTSQKQVEAKVEKKVEEVKDEVKVSEQAVKQKVSDKAEESTMIAATVAAKLVQTQEVKTDAF